MQTYIIAIAIGFPACFAAGAWCAIKGVQLGLRWQQAVTKGDPPEMSNPVADAVQAHREEKAQNETQELLDEYLNGSKDEQLKRRLR